MIATQYRTKLNKALGKREMLTKAIESEEEGIDDLNQVIDDLEKAQAFIQKVAQETQEQLRYHISDIVQLALDTCFPDEYEFDIKFDISRGKTVASMSFLKNGHNVDPMLASGGGVVDLAAFALRISAWSLGHTDNCIILDEPFRFLSKDLQPKAGQIMKRLSKKLNLQFIIVTHSDSIIDSADMIFEVSKVGDVSKVIARRN